VTSQIAALADPPSPVMISTVSFAASEIHTNDVHAFAGKKRRRRLSVTPTRADGAGPEYDCDFVLQATGHDESQNPELT
jgi:hypothetical protein